MFRSERRNEESNTGARESNNRVFCIANDFSGFQILTLAARVQLLTSEGVCGPVISITCSCDSLSPMEVSMNTALCQDEALVVAPDEMTELVRGDEQCLV